MAGDHWQHLQTKAAVGTAEWEQVTENQVFAAKQVWII